MDIIKYLYCKLTGKPLHPILDTTPRKMMILLYDLVAIDGDFSDSERGCLEKNFSEVFGVEGEKFEELIKVGENGMASMRGSLDTARTLAFELSDAQKEQFLSIIKEVIAVDGRVDEAESCLSSRIEEIFEQS